MTKKDTHENSRVSEAIAYTAALTASTVTTWATIRREFYAYVKGLGTFDKIAETLDKELAALNAKTITSGYLKEARSKKNDYSVEVGKIYKAMNISENIVKGSYDKFKHTGTTGKIKVGGVALIGASILLGTIVNFHQRRNTAHIKKAVDELMSRGNTPQIQER